MDLNEILFGSFDRRYCNYFYVLMVVNLFAVVVSVITMLLPIKMDPRVKSVLKQVWFPALVGYFETRMYYSMCLR